VQQALLEKTIFAMAGKKVEGCQRLFIRKVLIKAKSKKIQFLIFIITTENKYISFLFPFDCSKDS